MELDRFLVSKIEPDFCFYDANVEEMLKKYEMIGNRVPVKNQDGLEKFIKKSRDFLIDSLKLEK